jgi:hypothetical protein
MKNSKEIAIGIHAREHLFSRVFKIGSAIKYFLLSGIFFISGLVLASYSSQSMAATCGICDSQYLQCLNTGSVSSCKSAHKSCMSVCMSDGPQEKASTPGVAEWFAGLILGAMFAFGLMYTGNSVLISSEYKYYKKATILFGGVFLLLAIYVAFKDRGSAFYSIFNALCFLAPPLILIMNTKKDSEDSPEVDGKTEEQVKADDESKRRLEEHYKKYGAPQKGSSVEELIRDSGIDISILTIAEIAKKIGKSERAVSNYLARAQLKAKDYSGK